MRAYRLALISTAMLLGHPSGAKCGAVNVTQADTTERLPERTAGLRYLKHKRHHHRRHHHRHHAHHKAVQDMFKQQDDLFAYNDDNYESGYYYDDDNGHKGDVYFPEYLDEDTTPRPFHNCIPESFHEHNMHGKRHHHKHHHNYGGPDHHHNRHSHSESFLRDFEGVDDELGGYYNKGTKGATGKGKGRGTEGKTGSKGKSKSAKGSKKAKSKGYHRERNLARRNNHGGGRGTARAKKGFRTVRRGHHPVRGKIDERRGNGADSKDAEETETEPPIGEEDHEAIEPKVQITRKYTDGRNHLAHKHTHRKGGLPLCPGVAPKRRTFGPIPTVAPREPSTAPVLVELESNSTMIAPSIAETAEPGDAEIPAQEGGDMGGALVDIPPGTSRVLVESSMNYAFFDDNPVTEPTMAEIDDLLTRTSKWYTDQLKMAFPSLDSFQATFVDSMYDPSAEQPVTIDFDANAFFPQGEATPTNQEIFMAMEMLDYQDYIMSAVWTTDMTGGVFDDVNEAGFEARVSGGRRR